MDQDQPQQIQPSGIRKIPLGCKLDAEARRLAYIAPPEQMTSGLMEYRGTREDLENHLVSLGGKLRSFSPEPRSVTYQCPAGKLWDLEKLHGISHIEASRPMWIPEPLSNLEE